MKTEFKNKCTLTDPELTEKCGIWINKLCKSGGNAWSLQAPVNFNEDPDILFSELIKRFRQQQPVPALTEKQMEQEADEYLEMEIENGEYDNLPGLRKGYYDCLQKRATAPVSEETVKLKTDLVEALAALSSMWNQYCQPIKTESGGSIPGHMFMSAGEDTEDVLFKHGLMRDDGTSIYDTDNDWPQHLNPKP